MVFSALTLLLSAPHSHSAAAIFVSSVSLPRAAWEPKYEDEKKFYYASKVVQDKHNLDGSTNKQQQCATTPPVVDGGSRRMAGMGLAGGCTSANASETPKSDVCHSSDPV